MNNIDFEAIRDVASIAESRICGFVLFKTTDADMVKVMRDPDYLRAINDMSGERWPIFSVKPLLPATIRHKGGGKGQFGLLIMEEVDPAANLPVIEFFGLDKTNDTPCFVLFCWDDESKLLVTHYKLTTGSVETAFNSLKEVVKEISQSESQILPKYRKEMGVYREARASVEHLKAMKRFEKGSAYGIRILDMISSLTGLVRG